MRVIWLPRRSVYHERIRTSESPNTQIISIYFYDYKSINWPSGVYVFSYVITSVNLARECPFPKDGIRHKSRWCFCSYKARRSGKCPARKWRCPGRACQVRSPVSASVAAHCNVSLLASLSPLLGSKQGWSCFLIYCQKTRLITICRNEWMNELVKNELRYMELPQSHWTLKIFFKLQRLKVRGSLSGALTFPWFLVSSWILLFQLSRFLIWSRILIPSHLWPPYVYLTCTLIFVVQLYRNAFTPTCFHIFFFPF